MIVIHACRFLEQQLSYAEFYMDHGPCELASAVLLRSLGIEASWKVFGGGGEVLAFSEVGLDWCLSV